MSFELTGSMIYLGLSGGVSSYLNSGQLRIKFYKFKSAEQKNLGFNGMERCENDASKVASGESYGGHQI